MTDIMLTGIGQTFFTTGAPPPVSFLVQESDGTSKFTLEDGTGSIILEV